MPDSDAPVYPTPTNPNEFISPYLKDGVTLPPPPVTAGTPPQNISSIYLKPQDNTPPAQPFTWRDTWPIKLGQTIASGLTLPGDVAQGKATVPQSANMPGGEDISSLPRVNALASVIGTGAIPSVTSAAIPAIDPATAQLASLARDGYGIPIRGGQISAAPAVRYLDSTLATQPFSGIAENNATQQVAFNRAIAATIGENTDKITPEVMDAAKTRLGQSYENIAGKTTVKLDDQFGNELNTVASGANTTLAPGERSIIHSQIQNVLDKVQGTGEIDGPTYQSIIRTGSPLDRATKSNDSNVKYYAGQIKDSLIGALNRSAPPEVQAELAQTNSQYKAMKTIEPLVEKSTTGDISPAGLMQPVRNSYGNMAYGGGGQLGDLARIGQRFMKDMPQSGTQPRQFSNGVLALGGLGAAAEGGILATDPILAAKIAAGAVAAGTARAVINKSAGSFLKSDWYANKLLNSGSGAPNVLQKISGSNAPYLPPAALTPPPFNPLKQLQYSPENFL